MASKNRAKGTIITKIVESVGRNETRSMLINQIVPAIIQKWPPVEGQKSLMHKKMPKDVDDMMNAVNEAFYELEPRTLANVWLSYQYVMNEILKVKGTNDYLVLHVNKKKLAATGQHPVQVTTPMWAVFQAWNLIDTHKHIITLPEKKPTITAVPKSQVLGKLKDFLPVMSEANKKLQLAAMDNTKVFDIESLEDDDSAHIEMDLMLGVADLHTPEAIAAAESAINGNQPVSYFAAESNSDEDSDGDSESTSDDDDDKNQGDFDKHDQGKNDSEVKCSVANTKIAKSVGKDPSEELRIEKSSKRPKIVELS